MSIISAFLVGFRSYSACEVKSVGVKKELVYLKPRSKSQETEYASRAKENNIHTYVHTYVFIYVLQEATSASHDSHLSGG